MPTEQDTVNNNSTACEICEHPFVYNIHWAKVNDIVFPICTYCKEQCTKIGLFEKLFIEIRE